MRMLLIFLAACGTTPTATDTDLDTEVELTELIITGESFGCITDMEPVRGFYVDNLLGDVAATVAVANDLEGNSFPVGSVVQLIPLEVMVKREAGFSEVTNDWEFFALKATSEGTEIESRGAEDTVNAFGGNCFDCHAPAANFDYVCEQDNGCEPLPFGPEAIVGIQEADPRCP
jgi:hypothetical protein